MIKFAKFGYAASAINKKPPKCYYKLLNVSTKATPEEIKASYYELGKNIQKIICF